MQIRLAWRLYLGLTSGRDDAQIGAAISNVTRVVNTLHDPSSQLLSALKTALAEGKLCIVDISQMRGQQGLQLAGVILNNIFEHNQEEWTKAEPKTIPTIAVVEEAQSVLGGSNVSEDSPFVAWVKEGRKYDLGAVLVTQQPGSLPQEIVSQGDNFFVFHLLSAADLTTLKRANAHFSDDLLSSLLNEPIVGHGIYWSSAPGTDQGAKPYPVPMRVFDFAFGHSRADPSYKLDKIGCYASRLRGRYTEAVKAAAAAVRQVDSTRAQDSRQVEDAADVEVHAGDELDAQTLYRQAAIDGLRNDSRFASKVLRGRESIRWGTVQAWLSEYAPEPPIVANSFDWAYAVVVEAMNEILGREGYKSERRPESGGASKVWFVPTPPVDKGSERAEFSSGAEQEK